MAVRRLAGFVGLACMLPTCVAQYAVHVTRALPLPHAFSISRDIEGVLDNSTILVGHTNTSIHDVGDGSNDTSISTKLISPLGGRKTTVQVDVHTEEEFIGVRFNGSDSDSFYGVWEYPFDNSVKSDGIMFDLKGVGNSDGINWCNARAPFFISSSGFGVFADTDTMGSFDFTTPGQAQFIFNTSSLTYYVIFPEQEGSIKSILEQYVSGLSDTITMPPDTGYGPMFWNDDWTQDFEGNATNSQESVYDVVDHLSSNEIRASAIMLDRPYGTGSDGWGNFDLDKEFFPDPQGLVADLTSSGLELQVWVANRAYGGSELYETAQENGWLFGTMAAEDGPALNLSIPEAYDAFKEYMRFFPDLGIKGFKIDRGEEGEMPVYEQNVQITLFDKLCYEVLQEKFGDGNFYTFGRSVPDQSRKWTNVWNGDPAATWEGLAYTLTSGIRAGLMGFSNWGSDTGGYNREDGNAALSEEIWARWMWLSTFSPVYEFLLGEGHTPWYSPYTSKTVAAVKQTSNMHHDLIPYIRSFTYEATQSGIPVMRALFLEAPDDPNTWNVNDQYFFGSELLIAPIVAEGGQREVYFPKGTLYLEYFNKTDIYEGGSTTDVDLDWTAVPAYVKAGAIVARGDVIQGNALWIDDWAPQVNIEFYPSYDVPDHSVGFWTGKEQVPITVTTDSDSKKVTVTYGAVGIEDATYEVYTRNGTNRGTLDPSGGHLIFANVNSLFDIFD